MGRRYRLMSIDIGIYRSLIEKSDTTTRLYEYRPTMRPPGNVPYVVDNLWEWKRPEEFPNRRFSVFASPRPELAKRCGPSGGKVFQVKLNGEFKLAQLKGKPDSKFHSDCNVLRKLLFHKLGQDWLDGRLAEKSAIGMLWLPCLKKDEIERLFNQVEELRGIKDEIFAAIQYWQDVAVINNQEDISDKEGELFFEPIAGYTLCDVG